MLARLLVAWCLMALCVAIHGAGIAVAIRRVGDTRFADLRNFWHGTWFFIQIAGWMVLLHLVEIAVWGFFYVGIGAMEDLQSALYFSGVTYTTTGYGDLVLPQHWRLVGGVEALTGILMCGWSTAFFVAIVNRKLEAILTSRPSRDGGLA